MVGRGSVVAMLHAPALTGDGGEIVANTPDEFAAMLRRETTNWTHLIRSAGVKLD